MTDKYTEHLTLRLTEEQQRALAVESEMREIAVPDLLRGFIQELQYKHRHAFNILAKEFNVEVNNENNS